MAPITRRSQATVNKPSSLRTMQTREGSWEHVDTRSKQNGALPDPESPLLLMSVRPQHTLTPLKAMADKVGNEVEEFAEKVDLWYKTSREGKNMDEDELRVISYRNTMTLADEINNVAHAAIRRIRNRMPQEQQQDLTMTLRKRVRGINDVGSRGTLLDDSDDEDLDLTGNQAALHQAELEADTWELFRIILNLDFHEPGFDMEAAQIGYLENRGPVTKYTPESDIWERFLMENKTARERQLVLKWLENAAREREEDLGKIMDHLERAVGPNQGTMSGRLVETRERIKGAKRIRMMETPLPEDLPNFKTLDQTQLLATQLDPDAASRQHRALEERDEQRERSIWLACFEMLRRGIPWAKVRGWCDEHEENWRAVSFGMAYENQDARTCLGGAYSGALWRRMCYATARNGATDKYERAVYGFLAGDMESVEPVCRTWDDFLYAHQNSLLLSQFEKYLQDNFPDRISAVSRKFPVFDAVQFHGDLETAGSRVIEILKTQKATSGEAKEAMKLIQGSLLSRTFFALARDLGIALAKQANANGLESKLLPPTDLPFDESVLVIAKDPNALRMMAHILLVFRMLDTEGQLVHDMDFTLLENVIVSYIDFLRVTGKIECIPTYGAVLSSGCKERVLAMVLLDISNPEEQKTLVELMKNNQINLVRVFNEQYLYATESNRLLPDPLQPLNRLEILQPTAEVIYPGYKIKDGFEPNELFPDEEKVIRSVEWFLYIDATWETTFKSITFVLRTLLLYGRFDAAVELTRRLPYKTVSIAKSADFLNKSVDVMDPQAEQDDTDHRRSTRAGTRQNPQVKAQSRRQQDYAKKLEQLRLESRECYDLQQLVQALYMLSEWNRLETEFLTSEEYNSGDMHASTRDEFRRTLEAVKDATEPVFSPDFLSVLVLERHAQDYENIREAYLPSVVLAYISVLTSAGTYLTRDHLLAALELSTTIAAPNNAELASVFQRTGRMRELVEAFAQVSKRLLRMNHEESMVQSEDGLGMGKGKGKKKRKSLKKKSWNGSMLEIWEPGRGT